MADIRPLQPPDGCPSIRLQECMLDWLQTGRVDMDSIESALKAENLKKKVTLDNPIVLDDEDSDIKQEVPEVDTSKAHSPCGDKQLERAVVLLRPLEQVEFKDRPDLWEKLLKTGRCNLTALLSAPTGKSPVVEGPEEIFQQSSKQSRQVAPSPTRSDQVSLTELLSAPTGKSHVVKEPEEISQQSSQQSRQVAPSRPTRSDQVNPTALLSAPTGKSPVVKGPEEISQQSSKQSCQVAPSRPTRSDQVNLTALLSAPTRKSPVVKGPEEISQQSSQQSCQVAPSPTRSDQVDLKPGYEDIIRVSNTFHEILPNSSMGINGLDLQLCRTCEPNFQLSAFVKSLTLTLE